MNENYSYLDSVRVNGGAERVRAVFQQAYKENRRGAIILLNDNLLTFPCLYILMPQIEKLNLYYNLNPRNMIVLRIVRQILKPEETDSIDYLSTMEGNIYKLLMWMVESGSSEDCLDEDYETVMDVAVSVLINTYRDKSILPLVADMIFKRNKKGHFIHDLAWAYFQVQEPFALELIAKRMNSSDNEEVELACNLLNIDNSNEIDNRENRYEKYLNWIKDNDPFLYYTGESFQYASNPAPFKIDLERKYLNKGIPSYDKLPITPLDEEEGNNLKAFKALDNEEQIVLSEYSFMMHNKSVDEWKRWIHDSIVAQVQKAKDNSEGLK